MMTALLFSLAAYPRRGLRLALLAGLGAAAGCEAPATRHASAIPPPAAPPLAAVHPARPVPLPTAAQLGYHRYVGTIGGRPVLAEFTLWLEEDAARGQRYTKLAGSFYYRATGLSDWLGDPGWVRPDQRLETGFTENNQPAAGPRVLLRTAQPPGLPLLTGSYTPPDGPPRALPVCLRESYADGVRYELLHEGSQGRSFMAGPGATDSTSVAQDYLHLLGPDTLRPALARLQCPPPAGRRRARLALAARLSPAGYRHEELEITLNEASLLGYTRTLAQGHSFSRYYLESQPCRLVDLRTGQALLLAAQLRPGGWRQVQRLLTRQALADTVGRRARAHWWRGGQLPLPSGGFAVTPTGWLATYAEPESDPTTYAYSQTLPWATLRPLLRPGSPLHRLLRVRGL